MEGSGYGMDALEQGWPVAGGFLSIVQGMASFTSKLTSSLRNNVSEIQDLFGGRDVPAMSSSNTEVTAKSTLYSSFGRMTAPLTLCGMARHLPRNRTLWMGAIGVAVSLTAAYAATSAEIRSAARKSKQRVPSQGVDNDGVCGDQLVMSSFLGATDTSFESMSGKERAVSSDSWCVALAEDKVLGGVVEPKTKSVFPLLLCSEEDGADSCQILAGVGLRSKTLVKVKTIKVYAFGLYVHADELRRKLGPKYQGVPPEELKKRKEFYDDLLSHELGMTVRLIVHYKGLSPEMVRSAFATSLRNRLRKFTGSDDDSGLKVFNSYFSQPLDISRGTTIDFEWQPGGRLVTEIAGRRMEPIVSYNLCRAFFDMYIGEPPVSEPAKDEIVENVARLISGC